MAGAGYGVTPMSRLSQDSSRRRHRSPQAGKLLDLDSPNTVATSTRKKIPKRKTLSSRYTAELPSKRRKLGIDTINGFADLASALTPEACHSTRGNHKDRESKHLSTRGRTQNARAKVKARARVKARIKANGVQGDLIAKVSKVLASKANTAQSPFGPSDLRATLLTLNENASAGYSRDGNQNLDLSTSPLEKVTHIARLPSESKQVGTLVLDRFGDHQKLDTDNPAQGFNRGLGRKSSSKCLPSTSCERRAERDHDGSKLSGTASPSLFSESQPPESLPEDSIDGNLHSRHDSGSLEGRSLRPRQHARKKSKFDNQRLPPWDYVGKRVVVYWPHAKAWFAGKVIQYDDSTKKHKIKYDDNDEECISFRRHKVVLEKSSSAQSVDCLTSVIKAGRVAAEHHLVGKDDETDVEPCKSGQFQEDFDEDNALLSAFALRPRVRDASQEQLCNGSVKPVGAGKRVNSISSKDSPSHKASKIRMALAAQGNSGRTGSDERVHTSGARGTEAALVYVRRTKDRQKDDGLLGGPTPNGRLNDSDSMSGACQQGRPWKRKKLQPPFVQQLAQVDFMHGRYCDTKINPPVAPDTCEENGGGGSVTEHSLRKRNKRSLKKLVSQVLVMQGLEVGQELEPRRGGKRERGSKRRGRKLMRKHKLARSVSGARDRRFPTERVSDDAGGLAVSDEAEGSTRASDMVKLQVGEPLTYVLELHSLFCHTIYLVLPVVIPDVFTWQLFSIFASAKFCEDSPFDDRVSLKGSVQDWKNIFRVILGIVKAVPLSTWNNGRQWQCRILHETWNAMRWCGPFPTDISSFLPVRAENVVLELFRCAISNGMMTSRQIMNLLVCFVIKPYVIATICERGARFKLFVQQVLMLEGSKDGSITCLQKSLRSFPVHRSFGNADADFSSYLMLFPRSTDWCLSEGLFLRQMKAWIESAACTGYAEKWLPVSAIKNRDNVGWEITSAHFVNHGCSIDKTKSKIFKLEQGTVKLGILNNSSLYSQRCAEGRLLRIDQNDGWAIGLHNCQCLSSALLVTSFLQRCLYEGLGARSSSSSTAKFLVPSKIPLKDKQGIQFASTKLIGVKEESDFGAMAVPVSCGLTKPVKSEPDTIFSRRNSSITTESNSVACKEESSVEMYGRQQTLGGFPSESDEQHFSGQIDQEYYLYKRSKDTKKVKKSGLRPYSEELYSIHDEPSTFCCADLLFKDGDRVLKKRDVQVEVQPNGKIDFLVAVHVDGVEIVGRRLNQVSIIGTNPSEFRWKSGFGWALDFRDKEQWELFRSIYNELCIRTVQGITKDIPVPVVKGIEASNGADGESSSIRPFFAIRYQEDEIYIALRKGRIIYDLDSEDESWLKEINEENGSNCRDYRLAISDDVLERIIDRLEKEAFKREDHCVDVHDAIHVCEDLGEADVVRAIYTHWSNKRLAKGKALIGYFQPPLWEQYQDELRTWEARMENCPPNTQSMLLERYPRPVMSAFCLQSRTSDAFDTSRRVLRQRSQRKIRPPSRSSSEESYRLPAAGYRDAPWHLTNQFQHTEVSTPLTIGLHTHALRNQVRKKEDGEETEEVLTARATAVDARKLATARATKLQRHFLEFDLLLHRAWTTLIEYEAVAGVNATGQFESVEGRMACLFNRCSSLLRKGDDSSEDDDAPSHSGQVSKDVGQEFLDAFARKCSLNGKMAAHEKAGNLDLGCDAGEEASPLLPISVKASLYSWNGSTLL